MKYEEMSDLELLDLYEKYVYNFQIDPEAPEEAKTRGRRKKELWNKGTILG